jgi:hypothetical protein
MTTGSRRILALLCLALLAWSTPCLGGVVEDAEEALQGVPSDGPGLRELHGPQGAVGPDRIRPTSGSASQASVPSSPRRAGGANSASGSGRGGRAAPETAAPPDALTQEAMRLRQARDSSDNALSLLGVVLLLALVVAAGIASKRLGRDD